MDYRKEKIGEELRDAGMQRAVDHADKNIENWSDIAYRFLINYMVAHEEFMTEDVRNASVGKVPTPPSSRAWGAIIVRAAKNDLITRLCYRSVTNKKAHATPATVWQVNY